MENMKRTGILSQMHKSFGRFMPLTAAAIVACWINTNNASIVIKTNIAWTLCAQTYAHSLLVQPHCFISLWNMINDVRTPRWRHGSRWFDKKHRKITKFFGSYPFRRNASEKANDRCNSHPCWDKLQAVVVLRARLSGIHVSELEREREYSFETRFSVKLASLFQRHLDGFAISPRRGGRIDIGRFFQ